MGNATKSNVKSFVNQFIALIEGDDAKALAESAFRQRTSALKSHISSFDGDTIDLEDKRDRAIKNLEDARVNFGKPISDRAQYIKDLYAAKDKVSDAEEALEDHKRKIEFLTEELARD